MAKIYNYQTFDLNTLHFNVPKKVESEYRSSIYGVNENNVANKVFFQSPKVKVYQTFLKTTENEQKTIECDDFVHVLNEDETFFTFVKNVDDTIRETIKQKSEEWFPGKNIDDTFLEVGQVKSILKSGQMAMRIVQNDIVVYDENKEEITLEEINKLNEVIRGILQLVGIWFTPTRWGLTWKLVQVRKCATKKPKKLEGYMFPEDEEETQQDDDNDSHVMKPPPGIF